MNFFILNCLFFILYSQKYPDFIKYVDQELQVMKCCVCAVDMEKDRIVISNPCSHFLCPDCAAELIRNWELDGRKKNVQCAGPFYKTTSSTNHLPVI